MAVSRDILATYRGPGAVVRRILALGPREDRALAFVTGACAIMYVAQWPRLSRDAHLQDLDLNMEMGGALLGTVFILPLLLYVLAGIVHMVARLVTKRGTAYDARVALFWALLAASPLALLYGLMAGFAGPGAGLQLVGFVWFALFMWFWIGGMRAAYGAQA